MAFLARMGMRSYNTQLACKQGIRSPCEDIFWPSGRRPQPEGRLSLLPRHTLLASGTSGACNDDCGRLRASDLHCPRSDSTAFLRSWRNGPFAFSRCATLRGETTANSGPIR
jgi:hypothetical protein